MITRTSIFSRPWLLLTSFCTLLISTELSGNLYIFLLISGMKVLAPQSLLGIAGIGVLIVFARSARRWLKIVGAVLLLLSVVAFFSITYEHTADTFFHALPVLLLMLFLLLWVLYLFFTCKPRVETRGMK